MLDPSLFEPVAMLDDRVVDHLLCDELKEGSMLVDHVFDISRDIVFTSYKAVSEEEVIVVFSEIVANPCPEQQLLQIANDIVITILNLVVPIPSVIDLFTAKILIPHTQVTVLSTKL
jgi:hypothetical protein